ncbi:VC0807 family protein [Streptomyces sp. NPDC056105]|uniref:VC0807 family protein n=1 Tax=Streptomyces sp. NPDC056105 TaxID=3345714 RepID=UPI0035E0970D
MSQVVVQTPVKSADATAAPQSDRAALLGSLKPLIVDVVVPMASYYVLSKAFGMSTLAALGWSSVLPALRTVWGVLRDRRLNVLAGVILVVNMVGLLLSTVTGDPRLMLAKDSGISSVVGISMLVSVVAGKPLLTSALKPFVTKGDAGRTAAWERLSAEPGRFVRAERTFTAVWGLALVTECVVRIVGAYTLPVDTMVWLGNVIMVGAVVLAIRFGGRLAVGPMERMVEEELASSRAQVERVA